MKEYNVEFTTTLTVKAKDEDDAENKAIKEFNKYYGKAENFTTYTEETESW